MFAAAAVEGEGEDGEEDDRRRSGTRYESSGSRIRI